MMKINLASTKLAFFLISILLIFIVLSALIPQKDIASDQITDLKKQLGSSYVIIEKLRLDEIYTTPYFFVVLALLGVNLILGNFKRFRIIYKTEKTLIKTRHLGSILFHFSLIIVLVGIILNYLYKFEGLFAITEGQTVSDDSADYTTMRSGPLYEDPFDRFKLLLNKVDIAYPFENTYTTGIDVSIFLPYSSVEKKAVILTNKPLKYSGLEFHYGLTTGYTPELLLNDSSGSELFRSFVRVARINENGMVKNYDYVIIENLKLKFEVEVLSNNGILDSTLFKIRVASEEILLYDDTMKFDETVYFEGYSLGIPRLRQWGYISVIKSPYLSLVFWGFWLAILGLTVSLVPRVYSDLRGVR